MPEGSNLPLLYNLCLQAFKILGLILVAHDTNVISEPFLWLLLNRSRETCLAYHCIEVAVCRTEKYVLILIIILIIIAIVATFIGCRQKEVSYNLDEKS